MHILKEYNLGDMTARYLTDDRTQQVGLVLLPADLAIPGELAKNEQIDSLIQLKIAGDTYAGAYALGNSMRGSETVRRLAYQKQITEKNNGTTTIKTVLSAEGKYQVTHHLVWRENSHYVRIFCSLENLGEDEFLLEMFESASIGGLSPYLDRDGQGQMYLHRIRSVWSQEGLAERIPLENLQLEPGWNFPPHAVRCERFGQAGSMPVNRFFPFAAVEDGQNGVFWGMQIAHPASWQIELYRKDDALAMSGGLADRDFGHWMKCIRPGETFQTPEAIVSTAHTDSLDIFTGRLTEAAEEGLRKVPETEKDLPIVFNEYCTTWGCPSHENICKILDCIKDKGFRYFVIDAGWYKEEGIPWDASLGDYQVSRELFPEGLETTTEKIREAGMIPGIWFEIENVGKASRAWHLEEHLLHKDGYVLTSACRRFWNMCDPWVEQYLTERVIGTLKQYGFGYMKIDYNETIGIGCDGAESLGEGLRQNMEASSAFWEKVKKEVPGIVLENCASGGHRLEPRLMGQASMASFSDAHECEEIPIIAANLHRVIHPAQSQIWAVIRQNDSPKRIVYSLAGTFLGRMCISGDVADLSCRQWQLIDEGMDFYRSIAPIIRNGQTFRFGPEIQKLRRPKDWQAVLRMGTNGQAYLVIHVFDITLPEKIRIPLPESCPERIVKQYAEQPETISVENHCIYYEITEDRKAIAVLLATESEIVTEDNIEDHS